MAITRVQGTGQVTASVAFSVSGTFPAPPTVGNGVVVGVTVTAAALPSGCTDNRGNTYVLAKGQGSSNSGNTVAIYVCAAITTTGSPFTITVTHATQRNWLAVAVEVAGPIAIDQVASVSAATAAPTSGATPALTAADVFLVAGTAVGSSASSITVAVVTPPWTQEAEAVASSPVTGELDSRALTGVLGTTPSASWTLGGGAAFVESALVAFKGSAPPAVERVTPYVVLPL